MLNYKRSLHTSSDDGSMSSFKVGSPASAAISYVESLHQNARATLLYGKNNVLVLPVRVTRVCVCQMTRIMIILLNFVERCR